MQIVVAVLDKRARLLSFLHVERTETVAARNFTDAVLSPQGELVIKNHPADFALVKVGTFDEVSGALHGFTDLHPPFEVILEAEAIFSPKQVEVKNALEA